MFEVVYFRTMLVRYGANAVKKAVSVVVSKPELIASTLVSSSLVTLGRSFFNSNVVFAMFLS